MKITGATNEEFECIALIFQMAKVFAKILSTWVFFILLESSARVETSSYLSIKKISAKLHIRCHHRFHITFMERVLRHRGGFDVWNSDDSGNEDLLDATRNTRVGAKAIRQAARCPRCYRNIYVMITSLTSIITGTQQQQQRLSKLVIPCQLLQMRDH